MFFFINASSFYIWEEYIQVGKMINFRYRSFWRRMKVVIEKENKNKVDDEEEEEEELWLHSLNSNSLYPYFLLFNI